MSNDETPVLGIMTQADSDEVTTMTKWSDFNRTHEEACEEEGHLLYDVGGSMMCMRCPYTEEVSNADSG